MDLNILINSIGIVGSIETLYNIIKNIRSYIAKFFIAKETIDSSLFDLYFYGIDKRVFDEITKKDIEELFKDEELIFDVSKLMRSIENLFKSKGLNDEQAKTISFIIIENFIKENSKFDKNGALLQKLYLNFNNLSVKTDEILKKLNKFSNIKSLNEIESEIVNNVKDDSVIKNFDLKYFKIDDSVFKKNFDEFLNNNETVIKIACFIKEEALYCILNYLKFENAYEDVFVIYDEETWNKLQISDLGKTILIPYFIPKNYYNLKQNIKQIFLYTKDEENIDGYSIELRKRTLFTLKELLINEYKIERQDASNLINETNGNFYLIKNKVFICNENLYDNNCKLLNNQLLLLMFINAISNTKHDNKILLQYFNMDFDSLVDVIFKSDIYKKMFKIVRKYNAKYICLLDAKNIWQKYKLYENPDIEKWEKIYISVISDSDYLFILKQGLLKSYALLKFYTENNYFCDGVVNLLLKQINKDKDWEKYYELLDLCIEINSNIIIDRIYDELSLNKNTGLLNYFDDTNNQAYYKILWLIEKSMYLCDDIEKPLECLFLLLHKNYGNSGNNPKEIIRKLLFPGMLRPRKFIDCKTAFENVCKKHADVDIWDVCYSIIDGGISFSWNTPKIANFHEEKSENICDEFWNVYKMVLELSYKPAQIIKLLNKGIHLKKNYTLLGDEINKLKTVINNSDDYEKTYLYYKVKEIIYHYKYFKDESNWLIDNATIDNLNNISENIKFNDKIIKHLVYFINSNEYVLISPVTFKDDKHFNKNNEIAKQYKEKVLNKCFWEMNDLDYILKCYIKLISKNELEFETYNFTLGHDIAIYRDKRKFSKETIEILFQNFVNCEYDLYRTILDYIYVVEYNKEMVDCLIEYSKKYYNKNNKLAISIIKMLFRNGLDFKIIEKLTNEMQEEFWRNIDVLILDIKILNEEIIDLLLSKMFEYKNYNIYMETIELNERNFSNEMIIRYIKKLLEIENVYINKVNKASLEYLFSKIYERKDRFVDDDIEILSSIEMKFLNDCYVYDFKFSKDLFYNRPDIYAKYVVQYFWVKNSEDIKERQKVFMNRQFCDFKMNLNLIENYDVLCDWVYEFKIALYKEINDNNRENEIKKIYSWNMGRIVAMSENEADGTFPRDIFKVFIENNYDSDFEEAMVNTKYNLRGVYTPMQGEYNLSLSEFYKENIEACRNKYPKTAKVLEKLKKMYYADYKYDRSLSENENC